MTEIESEAGGGRTSVRSAQVVVVTVLAAAAAGALAVWIARDQMARHRRDLFSPSLLERLAALGYLAGSRASVESILLLKDFISWEPRGLLRGRARGILRRMEAEVRALEQLTAADRPA